MSYFNKQFYEILDPLGNIAQTDFDNFKSFITGFDKEKIFKIYTLFNVKSGDIDGLLNKIIKLSNDTNISPNVIKNWLNDGIFTLTRNEIRSLGSIFATSLNKVGVTGYDKLRLNFTDFFQNNNAEAFKKSVTELLNDSQYRIAKLGATATNFITDNVSKLKPLMGELASTTKGKVTIGIISSLALIVTGKILTSSPEIPNPDIVEKANDLITQIEYNNKQEALKVVTNSDIADEKVVSTLNNNKSIITSFFDSVSSKFDSWGFSNLWRQIKVFADNNHEYMTVILILGAIGIVYRYQQKLVNKNV